ncbi:MAG: hypothetical protein ACRET7_09935 [Burkholderiales bacterium]
MNILFAGLIAFAILWPAQAFSERPLKHFRVGDTVRSDEIYSIGPRAVQLPQANWHLIAIHRGENRVRGSTATAAVTTGVFAYIDGTRTLAFISFSASESSLPANKWVVYSGDCESTPVRFRDSFGGHPNQPECHEVRLLKNFLGSGVKGMWGAARERLSELGVGWSPKQLESRYNRHIWGDSFKFSVWVNPRLFSPRGKLVSSETNDDVPQAFVDWSKTQVEQLRLLSERKIRTFTFGDMPKVEETAIADLPPTQIRPLKTDNAPVSDGSKFPCTTDICTDVLKRYLDRQWPRALVVAKGRAFSFWGGEDPLANAMDLCKRRAESPESCRFYAVNNEIVWKSQ